MTPSEENPMGTNHDVSSGNPNADVIAGLRQAADFLEAHAELPRAYYAQISLRYADNKDGHGRATLTALATALGDLAVERPSYGGEVAIEGLFGPVVIHARASKAELAGVVVVPEPEYEPIIASRETCSDANPGLVRPF